MTEKQAKYREIFCELEDALMDLRLWSMVLHLFEHTSEAESCDADLLCYGRSVCVSFLCQHVDSVVLQYRLLSDLDLSRENVELVR